MCLCKYIPKVLDSSSATRCHQRQTGNFSHLLQLLDVIARTHATAPHAIEQDLTSSSILHFANPVEHIAPRLLRALGIAAVLIRAVACRSELTIDSDDDTLR